MTPEEALQGLDNLCASMSLSRQSHDQVKEAVNIIGSALAAARVAAPPNEE